jgi:hypothetical protein
MGKKARRQQIAAVAAKQTKTAKAPVKTVSFTREEISSLLLQYYMIRDCIIGEAAIKGMMGTVSAADPASFNGGGTPFTLNYNLAQAKRYLPQPNPDDQSLANIARFNSYIQRAVYYNVTSRTLEGMVGQVFLIAPVVEVPEQLKKVIKNIDGQGLDLTQLAKRGVRAVASYGRAGLFVDYPERSTPASAAEIASGEVQPIVRFLEPWNVINWRSKKIGVKTVLSMVVIREVEDDDEDEGFQITRVERYRVLKLDEDTGNYTVTMFENNGTSGDDIIPLDSKGAPFKEIPFMFVGAENNDFAVDKPPLFDLAVMNIAHYRNSADYEESSYQVGQPTPVATGLTEDWVKNVLKGKILLGSRAAVLLPVGADAKLLQAAPNTIPSEAMKHKEDQMVAIGAKLVMQKRVQKTATEAIVDSSSEGSVLSNVSVNVSQGLTWALQFACRFLGAEPTKVSVKLNTDFELNRMTFDDASKLVAMWQKGGLAFVEMRSGLRKAGMATLPDDEAKTTIAAEQAVLLAQGPVANDMSTGPAANPNNDPAGHAKNPASRNQ